LQPTAPDGAAAELKAFAKKCAGVQWHPVGMGNQFNVWVASRTRRLKVGACALFAGTFSRGMDGTESMPTGVRVMRA
jgi:hypothetical protein